MRDNTSLKQWMEYKVLTNICLVYHHDARKLNCSHVRSAITQSHAHAQIFYVKALCYNITLRFDISPALTRSFDSPPSLPNFCTAPHNCATYKYLRQYIN